MGGKLQGMIDNMVGVVKGGNEFALEGVKPQAETSFSSWIDWVESGQGKRMGSTYIIDQIRTGEWNERFNWLDADSTYSMEYKTIDESGKEVIYTYGKPGKSDIRVINDKSFLESGKHYKTMPANYTANEQSGNVGYYQAFQDSSGEDPTIYILQKERDETLYPDWVEYKEKFLDEDWANGIYT